MFRSSLRFIRNISVTSGPQGTDGRLPLGSVMSGAFPESELTSISITDPFILYQNYIKQGILEKDENQLRVMKEFQKLYHRLMDYSPPDDINIRISLLMKKLEVQQAESVVKGNRVIKLSGLKKFFNPKPLQERSQMIKLLTDEEELVNFNSPQGLLINGEVGCGKSMLMDLFAATLPYDRKMRWHFNNFILWVYNEINNIQNEKILIINAYNGSKEVKMSLENEFILFEIAQKMIKKNTILMLDEFMLPDIASANIIKILFTYYFKLGGVLVATSNKIPEELYSNEFHKNKFKTFVNILNYRCMPVDMKSSKDYRLEFTQGQPNHISKLHNEDHDKQWLELIKPVIGVDTSDKRSLSELGGQPRELTVYKRTTVIPLTFGDTCYLDFDYICKGLYSSSDYITLTSNFKTVIIDNVPTLTTKMKNEARRFITLLDAIYESKCQFYIRSEVPVDYIFFPDAKDDVPVEIKNLLDNINDNNLEVQDEEMFSKTEIALSNPYRPNVSTYDQNHTSVFQEEPKKPQYRSMQAFTGEDEMFAYKRAVLRIKEMVGSEKWRQNDRWVPIDKTMRPWESTKGSTSKVVEESTTIDKVTVTKQQLKTLLPRDLAKEYNIPFRKFNQSLAPVFDQLQHFWTFGKWNKKSKIKDKFAKSWINSSEK